MSERHPSNPPLTGDVLPEGEIAAFAYAAGRRRATAASDRLVTAGERGVAAPPTRVVPRTAEAALSLAPAPLDRLPQERVVPAADVAESLAEAVSATLALPDADWNPVVGELLGELGRGGYEVWLAGGVVRDLAAGGSPGEVNDLDLSGTAPPGRFTDTARNLRRTLGMEYRTKVSPSSLVCSAVTGTAQRHYEYRVLNQPGHNIPVGGSDPLADSLTRDFTVNTLLYDVDRALLVDPSGRGLADLSAPRRLIPISVLDDVGSRAEYLLRAVKFILRWGDDLDVVSPPGLPQDWRAAITEAEWRYLDEIHQSLTVTDPGRTRIDAAAKRLDPSAADLLDTLLKRSS